MALHHVTVYGEGGYDPSKPGGNVVEEYDVEAPDAPTEAPSIPEKVARVLVTAPELTPATRAALLAALGGQP